VAPRLRQFATGESTLPRAIKTIGRSEAAVDETIAEFFGRDKPCLGSYAKADGLHLRLIARAPDVVTAQALIAPIEEAMTTRLAPYVGGDDNETPEQAVGTSLRARAFTLATLECYPGGSLVQSLTAVPNSAAYLKGGAVVHRPDMAVAHGVPAARVPCHGLISQESATALAQAIRTQLGAAIGIGVAGVLGPAAVEDQPVGLAYVAIATANTLSTQGVHVPARRVPSKWRTSNTALIELCQRLRRGEGKHTMKHTKELAPRMVLRWDDETGIAWIENYMTGIGHAAHPNIKRPRSADKMKRRGAWGKEDRVVQSQGFLDNIDRLVIDEPLDDVARQHCQCGGNHTTARWYDLARQQWVASAAEGA
jgi:PncC family amidohydrolase